MLYLYGHPVSDEDAQALIAQLRADATPDAVDAAVQIEHALQLDRVMAGLSPDQRTAVLRTLSDPPYGLLGLRGALARDHARRTAIDSAESNESPKPSDTRKPFRVIVIDENRERTSSMVDLADEPESGDSVELPSGARVVIHHVATSRLDDLAGVIIAGPPSSTSA